MGNFHEKKINRGKMQAFKPKVLWGILKENFGKDFSEMQDC